MKFFRAASSVAPQAKAQPETKASAAAQLIYMQSHGQPIWSSRNYQTLVQEGYTKNVIVFRSVRLIAEAISSLPWAFKSDGETMSDHPIIELVNKPNYRQTGSDLLEMVVSNLLLAGNAYIEAVRLEDSVRELHVLRPDRMRVSVGSDGWPDAYHYTLGGRTIRYDMTDLNAPPILHLSLYHPLDDHYGFAPLDAAQKALDVHNTSSAWNKALLDNAARPSGALVYQGGDGNLNDEQFERLKQELEESFQGSKNAGRPLLLEGGLDWKAMSLSPRDLDFFEARNAAAREIALAFGVPPQLLGIPGDNTYSNYQEANRALWRQTILPLSRRISHGIGAWLGSYFDEAATLTFDEDTITVLAEERTKALERIANADFLTLNEKRDAFGYGPVENGDQIPSA